MQLRGGVGVVGDGRGGEGEAAAAEGVGRGEAGRLLDSSWRERA